MGESTAGGGAGLDKLALDDGRASLGARGACRANTWPSPWRVTLALPQNADWHPILGTAPTGITHSHSPLGDLAPAAGIASL